MRLLLPGLFAIIFSGSLALGVESGYGKLDNSQGQRQGKKQVRFNPSIDFIEPSIALCSEEVASWGFVSDNSRASCHNGWFIICRYCWI
ncbi:MAG: hypothetical protein H6618_03300 [Deltaproteobacteria bacterium]|nr:hypothetical protein [Deltaproteobacteria bacterium]